MYDRVADKERLRGENEKIPNKGSKKMTYENETWTEAEVEESIKLNVKDYGAAVTVAGLYMKLYGRFPKIGLSGAQADMAQAFADKLPEPTLELLEGGK